MNLIKRRKKTSDDSAAKSRRYFSIGKRLANTPEITKKNLKNKTLLVSFAIGSVLFPGVGPAVLIGSLLPSLFGSFLFEEVKGFLEGDKTGPVGERDLKGLRDLMDSKSDEEIEEMYKKVVMEKLDEEVEKQLREAIESTINDDNFVEKLANEIDMSDIETHLAAIKVEIGNCADQLAKEIERLKKMNNEMEENIKRLERVWAPSLAKSEVTLITAGEDEKDEFDDKSPARPEFCYGREAEVDVFMEFLQEIKEGKEEKRGFLVRGASGSGKSSFALKLKEEYKGAFLVIDGRGYGGQDFFLKMFAEEEVASRTHSDNQWIPGLGCMCDNQT